MLGRTSAEQMVTRMGQSHAKSMCVLILTYHSLVAHRPVKLIRTITIVGDKVHQPRRGH